MHLCAVKMLNTPSLVNKIYCNLKTHNINENINMLSLINNYNIGISSYLIKYYLHPTKNSRFYISH